MHLPKTVVVLSKWIASLKHCSKKYISLILERLRSWSQKTVLLLCRNQCWKLLLGRDEGKKANPFLPDLRGVSHVEAFSCAFMCLYVCYFLVFYCAKLIVRLGDWGIWKFEDLGIGGLRDWGIKGIGELGNETFWWHILMRHFDEPFLWDNLMKNFDRMFWLYFLI